jgi:hypothetical protein
MLASFLLVVLVDIIYDSDVMRMLLLLLLLGQVPPPGRGSAGHPPLPVAAAVPHCSGEQQTRSAYSCHTVHILNKLS